MTDKSDMQVYRASIYADQVRVACIQAHDFRSIDADPAHVYERLALERAVEAFSTLGTLMGAVRSRLAEITAPIAEAA